MSEVYPAKISYAHLLLVTVADRRVLVPVCSPAKCILLPFSTAKWQIFKVGEDDSPPYTPLNFVPARDLIKIGPIFTKKRCSP